MVNVLTHMVTIDAIEYSFTTTMLFVFVCLKYVSSFSISKRKPWQLRYRICFPQHPLNPL